MRVASLHIYPVKSMRGTDLEAAQLELRGLKGDRRWLAATPDGRFITQRSHPALARIVPRLTPGGVSLSAPGAEDLFVGEPQDGSAETVIWKDSVMAAPAGAAADRWLSDAAGEPLRLFFMADEEARMRETEWTQRPVAVSFADSLPVLVTTTGSLKAVNDEIERRGGARLPMTRFRPNIVIDCDDPWREDYWKCLRIGETEIELVKPCERCIVTTLDQESGAKTGREPLASLARLRLSADPRVTGVLFGWNAVPRKLGPINVGDEVTVIEDRPAGWAIKAS